MTIEQCMFASAPWAPPNQLTKLAADDETLLPELIGTFQEDTKARMERIRSGGIAPAMAVKRHQVIRWSARLYGSSGPVFMTAT